MPAEETVPAGATERRPRRLSGALLYFRPRLLIILAMGFASGLPLALTTGTLSIWLTEAGVSLTAIGLFALVGTPYSFKFAWAPLIDRVPIPLLSAWLGRRRSWMLAIQAALLVAIAALGMSDPAATPWLTAFLALAVAFLSASQDVVIDAYRIDILEESEQGAGAAMTQAGYRVGMLVSGAGALFLAEAIPWPLVYAVMAAMVLIAMLVTLIAPPTIRPEAEPRRTPPAGTTESRSARLAAWLLETFVAPFLEFFARSGARIALLILAFILLYKLGDAFAGVMANPFYIQVGFTKSQIAEISKLWGLVATFVGVFLGGLVVNKIGILRALLVCGLFQMLSNLMFALQAHVGADAGLLVATIGLENLSGGLGSAAFVAYLSVLCNRSFSGTQYALFSSFMAFGRTWLSASSGWVAEQVDWVLFFVISTGVAIPGLLICLWMLRALPLERQVAAPASD